MIRHRTQSRDYLHHHCTGCSANGQFRVSELKLLVLLWLEPH